MSEQRGANRWNADDYAKLAALDSDWRDSWWSDDFLELCARRWRLAEVRALLDVGTGAGHWGQRLARYLPPDAQVTGVDHEAGFGERARSRAARLGIAARYHFAVGDAESLPFPDQSFDGVTCQTVLMHVGRPERAIAEMHRVLRPGGLLVATEPDNLSNALIELQSEPRPTWPEAAALLGLQRSVEIGKQALGEGDSSIGWRLPALVTEAGFREVEVCINERCAALHPPYDDPRQQAEVAQELAWLQSGCWPAAGSRDDAVRLYAAGGGEPSAFDALWELQERRSRAVCEAMQQRRYHAARGSVQYVVWARR